MRLGDLLLEVRSELQRGVDAVDEQRDTAATGPRLDIRGLEVDLPFEVAAVDPDSGEQTGAAASDDPPARPARLQVTPGSGDAHLTVRFGPGTDDGAEADLPDLPGFPGGSAAVDAEPAGDDGDGEAPDDDAAASEGPIIPPVLEGQPLVVFDASVPSDRRAGTDLDVTAVEGVGQKRADALAGLGVETVADLAARDPAAVAAELATTAGQAERFVERARLMDLGADAQTAEVLADLDVSVDDLLEASPKTLLERVRAAADETTPVPDDWEPDPAVLETVVENARERRRDAA